MTSLIGSFGGLQGFGWSLRAVIKGMLVKERKQLFLQQSRFNLGDVSDLQCDGLTCKQQTHAILLLIGSMFLLRT